MENKLSFYNTLTKKVERLSPILMERLQCIHADLRYTTMRILET